MLLIGLGVGIGFPSLMTLAMSGATPQDSGLASGLVNTSMQVGGAIGLAVLATLATERTDTLLADGESQRRGAQLRLPPRLPDRRGLVGDRGRDRVFVLRAGGRRGARAGGRRTRPHAAEPAFSEAA